jgi:hypothetical protein
MATISANPPSIGTVLAQLISGGSSAAPAATSTSSASSSAATLSAGSGAAVFVTLSDQAKAAVATKVQSDSDAADRLQAFADEQRANNAAAKAGAPVSLQSIVEENNEATDTPPASSQPTTGSKVEAIVAQIKTLANANEPVPVQTFTPTRSIFSNSATADGYTLTLNTNANTQFYGVTVTGNGAQFADDHFGPDHGVSTNNAQLPPGVEIDDQLGLNNNEAEDAIMITQNVATASSASTSSSSTGSNSTSSVNAESLSITFEVNYATGQINVQQSAASVSARSSSASAPGSKLSTLA